MDLDTQFFTHCAATVWLIGIIAVLFVALVAVELWLAKRKDRRFMCQIGLHRSDHDYGHRMATGEILSHCRHCDKTMTHPILTMIND